MSIQIRYLRLVTLRCHALVPLHIAVGPSRGSLEAASLSLTT